MSMNVLGPERGRFVSDQSVKIGMKLASVMTYDEAVLWLYTAHEALDGLYPKEALDRGMLDEVEALVDEMKPNETKE